MYETTSLTAAASALDVHPRTILRLTTGLSNPNWTRGYDPKVDVAMLAAIVGAPEESVVALLNRDDFALDVHQAAKMFKCKPSKFYNKNLAPDWQVGRVKRYSLLRLGKLVA